MKKGVGWVVTGNLEAEGLERLRRLKEGTIQQDIKNTRTRKSIAAIKDL